MVMRMGAVRVEVGLRMGVFERMMRGGHVVIMV